MEQTHEVARGSGTDPHLSLDPLGLTLDDGKTLLAGVQRQLVQARVAEYRALRRRCSHCQGLHPLKDMRTRRLAMRIQHAAQCAGGWPANTVNDCRNRAEFTEAVEHIRWRLWHGQTRRALCLIQRTLAGGPYSEGERKNRSGQIGSTASEGVDRTGDLRIRSR